MFSVRFKPGARGANSLATRISRELLCLALALTLAPITCHATIILVTLTIGAVYLGADGRLTHTDENGNVTYGDACKIRQFGKIVVAYSGTVTDANVQFNVFDVLSSIEASSLSEFADKVADVLPSKFQKSLERSASAGKVSPNLIIPGDIAIVGFEDGKPAFIRILIFNDKGVVKAVKINEGKQSEKIFKSNPGIIIGPLPLGKVHAVSSTDFVSSDCWTNNSSVEGITRCMLKTYIGADPRHINEPIAVLKVTKNNVSWIEKGKCE